jgi:hypothetical protein
MLLLVLLVLLLLLLSLPKYFGYCVWQYWIRRNDGRIRTHCP